MSPEIPSDWHRDFFRGMWLDVQEHSFDPDQTRELVDAVQEALQLMPGARILDLPCGEGRVANELAARGFEVVGIDRSPELLERARHRATERDLKVDWREGDMWALEDVGRFDAALCLWGSIGYGTEEQDAACFEAFARALGDDGALMIDTHVLETLLPNWEPDGWRWAGPVGVGEARTFDPATGRIETEWILAGETSRETRHSSMRIYGYRELVGMLEAAGFGDFEAFGSPDLEPFELGASRLLLVARRRKHEVDD